MISHTRKWKETEVQLLLKELKDAKVVAVADLDRFPANLFGRLRKELYGKARIRVTKTRVAKKAFLEAGYDTKELGERLQKSIAIIFTGMNAFELYAFFKRNKGKSFAKTGMVLDYDLIVPAGDTGLPPGPDLADLKAAGIPVQMQGASIKVSKDFTITLAGSTVTDSAAKALIKLEIKPVDIAMNVTTAYEDKTWYDSEILNIDVDKEFEKYALAHKHAFNLAVYAAYPTDATIEILVQKAFNDTKGLSIESGILNKASLEPLLIKANASANDLKPLIKGALSVDKKEDLSAEKKPEEKPSEEKKKEASDEEKKGKPAAEKTEEKPSKETKEEVKEEAPVEEKTEKKSVEENKEEVPSKEVKESAADEKNEEKKDKPIDEKSEEKKE